MNVLSMSGTTIFNKNFKNRKRKVAKRVSKFKILKCSVRTIFDHLMYQIKIYVDIKVKLPTDGRNNAKDICAINRCTISSTISCNISRRKYIVSATLFSGYSYTLFKN